MSPITVVEKALALATDRAAHAPSFHLFESAVAQLSYLLAFLQGHVKDIEPIRQLTIGVLAAKEFAESDPEFAKALAEAYYVADQVKRGRRIDDVAVYRSVNTDALRRPGAARLPAASRRLRLR